VCAERRVKVAAILSVVLGGPSMRGLSLGTFAAAKLCRGQQGCTCDALHEIFLSVQPLAGGGTMFGLWLQHSGLCAACSGPRLWPDRGSEL